MSSSRIGEVYFAPDYRFADGETSDKLLLILAITEAKDYLVVRTTSQSRLRSWDPGCQNGDLEPGFFIPLQTSIFQKDTWLCLDYAINIDQYDFESCLNSKPPTFLKIGDLDGQLVNQILQCAASADFTQREVRALLDTLATRA